MKALPSIRQRMARATLIWSLLWSLAVSMAVGLAVQHALNEQFDEELQATAQVLTMLLQQSPLDDGAGPVVLSLRRGPDQPAPEAVHLTWQVVEGAQVILRSSDAPASALLGAGRSGFANAAGWRVFGAPLGDAGRMLYVAQTLEARSEEQWEVMLSTTLAALAVVLMAHVSMSHRMRRELEPLQALSDELAAHDPLEEALRLGPPQRQELAPMHTALEALGQRLNDRLRREQAFSAHAAHALRTPLAGMDAQLSVALREAPAELAPRLQRVRDAAGRLQHVVMALLALFRSDTAVQRRPLALDELVQRLPIPRLEVSARTPATLQADPDLLTAALLNLLDNALRHGATQVAISCPQPDTVRLHDNGPGMPAARREALQQVLDAQDYGGLPGLGLALADVVARAHGGRLCLPAVDGGFAVELQLRSRGDAPAA